MTRIRLDVLLADRGLFPSRSAAAAAVMAGTVRLGAGNARATKAGQMVPGDVDVHVDEGPRFVSRGGIKLSNALDHFGVDVTGAKALDIGASTGGFTDALLQRGAGHVVAVDVGYGELAWSLREDPRVTVLERTNARTLSPGDLPYRAALVVADVSFISLRKILPAALTCAAESFDAVMMVKPQFEVGRDRVGKGGVVREPAVRRDAIRLVAEAAREQGASVLGVASSGLPGPKGNRESFLWLAESGRAGAIDDLEPLLLAVEPNAEPKRGARQ